MNLQSLVKITRKRAWARSWWGIYPLGLNLNYKAVLNIVLTLMIWNLINSLVSLKFKTWRSLMKAKSKEEDRVARIEDNLSLMARNFNKWLRELKREKAAMVDKFKSMSLIASILILPVLICQREIERKTCSVKQSKEGKISCVL